MKKLFCLVLALMLLFSCATAEGSPTEKKNAFEFTDMYMQRLWKMKYDRVFDATHNNIFTHGYNLFTYTTTPNGEIETYVIFVTAGTLFVSAKDFTLEEMRTTFISSNKTDSQDMTTDILRASAAFAALEYTPHDDDTYDTIHKIDPKTPASVMDEATDILTSAFDKIANDSELLNSLYVGGNEVPLYSGNYDYYLTYVRSTTDDEIAWIDLVARSRE